MPWLRSLLVITVLVGGCSSDPNADKDTAAETDSGTDGNSPPIAPDVRIEPAQPLAGDELAVIIGDIVDPDGDPVQTKVTWFVDPPVEGLERNRRKVPGELVKRGQTWIVRVGVTDQRRGTTVEVETIIGNAAPTLGPLTITPQTPFTDSLLSATFAVDDLEGDTVQRTWTWKVNGTEVLSGAGNAFSSLSGAEAFDKGDEVTVTLSVDDGKGGVAERTSDPVTVVNSPPAPPVVAISPANPTTATELRCQVTEPARDPDADDTATYTYRWERGFQGTSFTGQSIAASELVDGTVWSCLVSASDGTDTSSEAWAAVQVGADTPSIFELALGTFFTCGRRDDGYTACWGNNAGGRAEAPVGPFDAITAGEDFGCGLDDAGAPTCWGPAGGLGATPARLVPPEGVSFEDIDADAFHTCGVTSTGSLACWGSDDEGESTPPEGTGFVDVAAGRQHACARTDAGVVTCWGSDVSGQLQVPDETFLQISASMDHTCGVTSAQEMVCWGLDDDGQATAPSGSFRFVATGSDFSCGVKSDGALACWGSDATGQSSPPTGTWLAVWAGFDHACGIDNSGGIACWGNPLDDLLEPPVGEYLSVSVASRSLTNAAGALLTLPFTCAIDIDGVPRCFGVANRYGAEAPPYGAYTQIAVGDGHSCGVQLDGTAACWGNDARGQSTPPAGSYVEVGVGLSHSCGLMRDQTVSCWGAIDLTQNIQPPTSGPFVDLAVGPDRACTIKTDGSALCWGSPTGQILGTLNDPAGPFLSTGLSLGVTHNCALRKGDDEGTPRCWGVPTGQAPSLVFESLSAGGNGVCGVLDDGSPRCWGLAIGAVRPEPEGTFRSVALDLTHACGIDDDNRLHCWGSLWRRPLDGSFPPPPVVAD